MITRADLQYFAETLEGRDVGGGPQCAAELRQDHEGDLVITISFPARYEERLEALLARLINGGIAGNRDTAADAVFFAGFAHLCGDEPKLIRRPLDAAPGDAYDVQARRDAHEADAP